MRSWQIVEWGKPLEPREYDQPTLKGREVLMKVSACGLCHSDLHIWQGYFDFGGGKKLKIEDRGLTLPFTMGHEVVGEVAAIGPDVDDVGIGDRRVIYPWIGCGTCAPCTRDENLLCLKPRVVGTWKDGGYSDYTFVPDSRWLVPFDGISEDLACTYACSGITAYSALNKTGLSRDDQTLLMIGAGGVGLQGVQIARAITPGRIAVADVDSAKRAAAEAAGAQFSVDNRSAEAVKAVRDWSNGGVDAAIDYVGRPETIQFAIDCLTGKGGTLVVVGLYGDQITLPVPAFPLRILTVRGSYVGTLQDLKDVIALAQAGKLKPIEVTARPLDEVNACMADLTAGRVTGRIVLKP